MCTTFLWKAPLKLKNKNRFIFSFIASQIKKTFLFQKGFFVSCGIFFACYYFAANSAEHIGMFFDEIAVDRFRKSSYDTVLNKSGQL